MKILKPFFLPAVLGQSPFDGVECNLECAAGFDCCNPQNSPNPSADAGKMYNVKPRYANYSPSSKVLLFQNETKIFGIFRSDP